VVPAGLRALQERDAAVERWLREEVAPVYDATQGVDEAKRQQAGRTAATACATEELRRPLGATCTGWQFARAFSGDTSPKLDLQIIRAGVARGRGTRRGRAEQDAGGESGAPDEPVPSDRRNG
jgi:hypothetical protein